MMDLTDSVATESEWNVIDVFFISELFELSDAESSIDARYISDTIKVKAIPEKRGTFLKHTEYEVSDSILLSAVNNSKICR